MAAPLVGDTEAGVVAPLPGGTIAWGATEPAGRRACDHTRPPMPLDPPKAGGRSRGRSLLSPDPVYCAGVGSRVCG